MSLGYDPIVRPERFGSGAPMEAKKGVRDIKVIYPEYVPTRTLCMGIVSLEPGAETPLHRHNCEEIYYFLEGEGEVEIEGTRYKVRKGDACYLKEQQKHRVFNTGNTQLSWVDVGGIMFTSLFPEWPTPSPYEIYLNE